MKLVMGNKSEGTDLFKGGNIKDAVQRYARALAHCEKFVDINTDDDKKEVADVQLSLYLNCAMCYLKLDNPDKAADNCTRALEIDGGNVKALFRRASAYE